MVLAERSRRQLHVHCYRMVGSLEDAEDLAHDRSTTEPLARALARQFTVLNYDRRPFTECSGSAR